MRILHSLTSHAVVSTTIALGVAALAVAGVHAWQATEAVRAKRDWGSDFAAD